MYDQALGCAVVDAGEWPLAAHRRRDCRIPDDACPEPVDQSVVRNGVVGDARDQFEQGGSVGVEAVAAAPEHQFGEQHGGALVAVGEAVVLHEPVEQGGGFLVDPAVVAAVGAPDGGVDGVLVEDPVAAAGGGERLSVEVDGVGPGNPVVRFSDWPARAGRRAGRR